MARTSLLHTCLRVAIASRLVSAATSGCYWPNGEDTGDNQKPCGSSGDSACCPDKWECLDNGLCHYEPDNLFGRYGCTDSTWKAEGCPSNMCTYDMTAYGGESITQCPDHNNDWCCNADAQHVDCCAESPVARPFFSLAEGKAYATIGSSSASSVPNLATITGMATSGSGGSSPSSTGGGSTGGGGSSATATKDDKSTTITAASTDPTATAIKTTLQTSVSSGSAGVSTMVITSIIAPAQTSPSSSSSSDPSSSSKSNLGVIIGCAVGIPLALALLAIIFWLLRKRHNQQKAARGSTTTPDPYANGSASPDFAGGAKLGKPVYASENNVPELAGQGVGPGRPVSNVKGRAELDSGAQFVDGRVPFAPGLVGLGGGNLGPNGNANANGNANGNAYGNVAGNQESWGSAPPGYSPGTNAGQWANAGVVEAPDTSIGSRPGTGTTGGRSAGGANLPPNMVEAPEHGSSPGEGGHGMQNQTQTMGGRYIPYRPPPGQT